MGRPVELSGTAVPEGKTKDVTDTTELLAVALNESVAFAPTLEAVEIGLLLRQMRIQEAEVGEWTYNGTATVAAGWKAVS